ncbi:MAG: rRNA maturation RNase YbeY [Rikenellaceae bacterium]|jgi:rRNA maturation RNase YbeY|nr:rRNA maturation RNase YbeY [Rikenellaceae bacterium]
MLKKRLKTTKMAITYHTETTPFRYRGRRATTRWIRETAAEEGCRCGEVAVIFCTDDLLLALNKKHLGHDYYTDIITFDYSESDTIAGDLFVSVDTVADNARGLNIPFAQELQRVMIHGILHLCGYPDKSEKEAAVMRAKEEYYLRKRAEAEP